MVMQQERTDEVFALSLVEEYNRASSGDPLKKVRSMAWEQYQWMGLPGKKSEVFRYIPMRQLYGRALSIAEESTIDPETVRKATFPECEGSVLTFVNGRFSPALSSLEGLQDQAIITPLKEAIRPYGAFLNNRWTKYLKEEKDPFAAINGALHQDGVFIYVQPKIQLQNAIQILHVIDCDEDKMVMPRVHLFAGAQTKMLLCERTVILRGERALVNSVIDIAVEEGASVEYSMTNLDYPADLWQFKAIRSTLKRDAKFRTYSVNTGAGMLREDYRVGLQGENGEAVLDGAWLLEGSNQAHANILMDHAAPHCRSSQMFKGVVAGRSRSSFEGKIYVHKEAQKTDAFQLNNNLILSEGAQADSKPNLEIFADDVKASHGATVGQVDPEQVFYLTTRGCSAEEAQNLLVLGYLKEVIDLLPCSTQRDEALQRVKHLLKKRGL